MKLKDQDGLYRNWVPIALGIGGIIYAIILILWIFPLIDKWSK